MMSIALQAAVSDERNRTALPCEAGEGFSTAGYPLARGVVLKMAPQLAPSLRYYLYLPREIKPPVRILVAVHGISRNAREHAELFSPYAETEGVILLVPRFGRRNFPGYQRLAEGVPGKPRADQALNLMVDDLNGRLGLCETKLYLFGFSGGGQFIHRYTMLHPARVERGVIGAAGWYTFPDPDVKYPRGLRQSSRQALDIAWPDFLRVPMTVIVGEGDIERDDALNQTARIDRQQGENRLQRGRRWVETMRKTAADQGFDTQYDMELLPGTAHDFTQAMTVGRMGELVFEHLFGEAAVGDSPAVHRRHLARAAGHRPWGGE